MNKYILVALSAILIITACGTEDAPQTEVAEHARLSWEEFAAATVAEYYDRNPETAVDAGLHEYDGQMEDFSKEALQAYGEWLDQVVAEPSSPILLSILCSMSLSCESRLSSASACRSSEKRRASRCSA